MGKRGRKKYHQWLKDKNLTRSADNKRDWKKATR